MGRGWSNHHFFNKSKDGYLSIPKKIQKNWWHALLITFSYVSIIFILYEIQLSTKKYCLPPSKTEQNKLITILSYNLLVIILFYNSACTLTFQFLNKFLLVSSNIMCHLCGVETTCHGLMLVYSKKFVVIPIIIKTWEYSTLPFQNKIINSLHPK